MTIPSKSNPFALSSLLFVLACGAFGMGCDDSTPQGVLLETRTAAIVDGERERGYPAIGALTLILPEDEYTGSFCTGTLIDPQWILTAAHCLEGAYGRMRGRPGAPDDTWLHFYVGNNADNRESGQLHRVRQAFIHPNYTERGGKRFYDVGLMQLEEPIQDVEPFPIFVDDLEVHAGATLFYAGFGMTDPAVNDSGGAKYSKNLVLQDVYFTSYVTAQNDGGVCFGDSGGPGLLDIGGTQYVIGVNSAAIGQDTCRGWSSQMRVDAFKTWIAATMQMPVSCNDNPDLCQCADACQADGVCDDGLCATGRCFETFQCFQECGDDPACQYGCFARLPIIENYFLQQVYACVDERCPDRDNPCVQQECSRALYACERGPEASVGDGQCGDIYRCSEVCNDANCMSDCVRTGTLDAQDVYDPVERCLTENCPDAPLESGRNACIARHCRAPLLVCLPPDECRLVGGDCDAEFACVPDAWGATYCRPSLGKAVGAPCALGETECRDGALCLGGPMGAFCQELCVAGTDCNDAPGPCERVSLPGAPYPLGVCQGACRDGDSDGTCDDDDCEPDNAAVGPEADEVCANEIDDDCDGESDEGCIICVDEDGDGICADTDCADDDATRGEPQTEVCGDEIDNDCDGETDEECSLPDASIPTVNDAQIPIDALANGDEGAPIVSEAGAKDSTQGCDCDTSRGRPGDVFLLLPVLFLGFRRRLLRVGRAGALFVGAMGLLLGGCIRSNDSAPDGPDGPVDMSASGADVQRLFDGGMDAWILVDGQVQSDQTVTDAAYDGSRFPMDGDLLDAAIPLDISTADMTTAPPTIRRIQQGLVPLGEMVELTGVLVGSPMNPRGFFISDGTSRAYSGVWVQLGREVQVPQLNMGQTIDLQGMVEEFNSGPVQPEMDGGVAENQRPTTQTRTQIVIDSMDAVQLTGAGDLPAPIHVSLGELAIADLAELYEGVLIALSEVTVTRKAGQEVILNGTLQVDTLFVPDILDWLVRGTNFETVIGIVDNSTSGYSLMPRIPEDMPRPPSALLGCIPVGATYAVCLERVPWRRSTEECALRGSRLVVLETQEENLSLGELVQPWIEGAFWIGLSDRQTEGEFVWHDGSPLTYSGWADGEPNDYGNGEDCAESNWRGPGVWNDGSCGGRKPYVCEYVDAVPPCENDEMCGEGQCVDGLCVFADGMGKDGN